jgi:hypothetical protein
MPWESAWYSNRTFEAKNKTRIKRMDMDSNFTSDYFECEIDECVLMDLILTMYNLDVSFKDMNFDDSLHFGLLLVAETIQKGKG